MTQKDAAVAVMVVMMMMMSDDGGDGNDDHKHVDHDNMGNEDEKRMMMTFHSLRFRQA